MVVSMKFLLAGLCLIQPNETFLSNHVILSRLRTDERRYCFYTSGHVDNQKQETLAVQLQYS